MSLTLAIRDETAAGVETYALTLEMLSARVTIRELIRSRVYQEVQDYNRSPREKYHGLVQPEHAERVLNGFTLKKGERVDFEKQFQAAVTAFEKNAFIILIDDRQTDDIDEEMTLSADTDIAFVKLTPLVGG